MKKILVPLDGSELSEKVLSHVETLAKKSGAEVILLRVVPFTWPNEFLHVREMGNKLDKEASDYLFAINAQLEEKGIKGECRVHEGSVPKVICDLAREREVDLIAMTTHGRGGVKRWALGSVADKVIQISPIHVLLCRISEKEMAPTNYKNILIPVDGSHFSEGTFPQVKYLMELFESKVWFLYVVDTHLAESFTVIKKSIMGKEEALRRKIKDYFTTFEKRLKKTGATNYEIVVREGLPAETISDFAEELEIDLIAMSTHGRGGIARWALGSVTNKVVQISSNPVLLIRAKK